MFKIAIFTATRWEYNAVRRALQGDRFRIVSSRKYIVGKSGQALIHLFRTGVGADNAAQVCQAALEGETWDLVISAGFAAALTPSKIGAILVADHIMPVSAGPAFQSPIIPLHCHPAFVQKAFEVGLRIDPHTRLGHLVTVQRIIHRASEKQEIAQTTGAIGLDMESAALGKIAKKKFIPFGVVRTVSDLMDEDLPEEFNLFLRHYGWVKGIPSLILSPKCWAHIFRLRAQMVQTSRQMTKFFDCFFRQQHLLDRQPEHKSAIG